MNTLLHFAQASGYYYTDSSSTEASNISAGATIAIILGMFVLLALVYVVVALLTGRIFKKAGIPSWIAWVPFYNQWKMLELGGQQGFWAVLAIIPLVQYASIVFMFIAMYNIGLKLGKSGSFVLWAIFFPYVWYIWLAVDQSTWNDSLGKPSLAIEHQTPPTAPGAPTAPSATL